MSIDLPKRSEVPVEDTWDLTTIFKTNEEWEKTFKEVEETYPKVKEFEGRILESAETLLELIKFTEELEVKASHLYVYTHLHSDTDVSNALYLGMQARAIGLLTKMEATMSFINPEILETDESVVRGYLKEKAELEIYDHYFDRVYASRPYTLTPKEESILASASGTTSLFSDVYSVYTNSEMKMPIVKDENGVEMRLSYGRYNVLRENPNKEVRREAFKAMMGVYGEHKNTLATTLTGNVKANNLNADVRGYKSARHAALFANNVDESVYDGLLNTIGDHLDVLHQYVDVRKRILGVDEINMYDLYTPLVEEVDVEFTKEAAKEIILEALQPLGEEYVSVVKRAFDERWMDLTENENKRSGAYSSGTYGTNPYILMNWQNSLDNVYTLAHELGHSLHSYYTRTYQPQVYGNYSIFVAEVASTTNEQLLTDYFLKKYADDEHMKAYILNHYLDGVRATVFRQTQFAEFEHFIYQADQKGEALTGEMLTQAYFDMNKKYYGETMTYDEEIGYEWALIPHFYYNYYVYQYATGFSAANALALNILSGDQAKIDAYINYLKAGSSDYPINVLKKAGVDMNTSKPVEDTMKVFKERLEQLEQLLVK